MQIVGSRNLKSSHVGSRIYYELLFKCLVSWLIYQKRSMPGRNSNYSFFFHLKWIYWFFGMHMNFSIFFIFMKIYELLVACGGGVGLNI